MSTKPTCFFGGNFPLYKMRAYLEIETIGSMKIIHTKYDTYILDDTSLQGDYLERRLQLLAKKKELPLKLYPLNERYTTLSQMVNSKARTFIDANGKIVHYKTQTFVKIQYCKVLTAERTWNGKYLISTKLPVGFVVEELKPYIGYFQINGAYFLYSLEEEPQSPRRKKV